MSEPPEHTQNEPHLMGGYSGIFFNKKPEANSADPLSAPVGNPIDKRKMVVAGSLLVLAAAVVICAGIKAAQIVAAPFFMACFLAIVLTAPLRWLKARGFSDFIALLIIIAGVLVFGISIIWILSGSVNHFIARVSEYTQKTNKIVAQIDDMLEPYGFSLEGGIRKKTENEKPKTETKQVEPASSAALHSPLANTEPLAETPLAETPLAKTEPLDETEPSAETEPPPAEPEPAEPEAADTSPFSFLEDPLSGNSTSTVGISGYLRIVIKELSRLATLCFIVMILVVFMMLEASRLPKKILNAFGANGITNDHLQAVVDKVWKYMIIKSIISSFVGTLVWIMLLAADVDYAMLWGLIAFFLNFVPNVGSIIAAFPGIALALFDHGFGTCLAVTIGYLLINQTLGYYVEPIWLGDGLGISPLVILLSLIFFGYLLGMVGMFLSAPLAIVVKIVCDSFEETRWIGILMSDK